MTRSYGRRVADDLTGRYGDLLTGSYDCVDRVVLNAYYPLRYGPGGFRVWWRRWHDDSDDGLDDAHLMRLAGRFGSDSRVAGPHAQARSDPAEDPRYAELDVLCAAAPLRMLSA